MSQPTPILHEPNRLSRWIVWTICLVILVGGVVPVEAKSAGKNDLKDLLELRSYIRIGDTIQFSVFNKEEKRGEWLRVNEEHRGYKIESYDPEKNEIVIRFNGQTGTLALQAAQLHAYSEPPPAAKTEPATASSSASRTDQAITRPNGATPSNSPPHAPNPRRQSGTRRNHDSSSPTLMGGLAGRGGAVPPPTPGEPPNSTPPVPDDKTPGSGNGFDDPYWTSNGTPPPLPPNAPPAYSPKD